MKLKKAKEAYTSADTQVKVDKSSVSGETATVQVTETTMLTYKKVRGGEPPATGFQARHELVFTKGASGGWELAKITSLDVGGTAAVNQPGPVADTTPADKVGKGMKTAGTTEPPGGGKGKSRANDRRAYSYSAMATYAERYWSNYNTAYRRFNDTGGDCTNFISQALKAGGWAHDLGLYTDYHNWWYNSANQTRSWINVGYWASFARASGRTSYLGNVYDLGIGDILQMDFTNNGSKDHSMMATYKNNGVPYLTYHSNNTYRRSVASIVSSNPGAVYYAFRT
ncbi:hypothetical protein GCM10027589_12430 [Actinocorallia lasiicapitis]